MEYYKYKNNVYKLVDCAKHKDQNTREWITTVLYTDGRVIYSRETGEFYERFTQIPNDSIEAAIFEIKQNLRN